MNQIPWNIMAGFDSAAKLLLLGSFDLGSVTPRKEEIGKNVFALIPNSNISIKLKSNNRPSTKLCFLFFVDDPNANRVQSFFSDKNVTDDKSSNNGLSKRFFIILTENVPFKRCYGQRGHQQIEHRKCNQLLFGFCVWASHQTEGDLVPDRAKEIESN